MRITWIRSRISSRRSPRSPARLSWRGGSPRRCGRCRPRWSTSSRPRRASPPCPASGCRPPSTSRPPGAGADRPSRVVAPKRSSTWLSTTSLSTSMPSGRDPLGEPPRERAAALDELRDARAAERAQRRVDREPAGRAATPRGPSRSSSARSRRAHEVGGGHAHRRGVGGAVADRDDAAVVGHVEPLVAVGRPRVGVAGARHEVRERRARRRPQAERAVDVHPRAVLARGGGDLGERVERARVDVARLRAHDRGRRRRASARERVGAHPRPGRRPPRPRPPRARTRAAAAPATRSRAPPRRRTPQRRRAASPCSSTSQPARASSAPRAAASPVTFAICAPVVSPTPDSGGRPSRSSSQPQATSSATAAAGEETALNAFWSHADASQSAASAAGSAPPVTKPK